jgi:putative endonuclease
MFRKRKAPHLRTGERGERAAALYLLLRGYRILERNYLCPPGEIDIVALKKGTIVFVEVRTRQEGALVDPIESINDIKLAHMIEAARYFLTVRGKSRACSRFDIISVRSGGPFRGRIRHYIDAFSTTDERPVRGMRLKAWIRRQPKPGGKTSKKPFDTGTR